MTVLSFFVAKIVVENGKRKAAIQLRYKYVGQSESSEDLLATEGSLTAFCFPLGPESVVPKEHMAAEEYTFTLTGGDGQRYQGFCRRFQPPKPSIGSKAQLPQVLCLVSLEPWCTFFFKVLQVLEQLLKGGDQLLTAGLKDLPPGSLCAGLLNDLGQRLADEPRPSDVIKLPLPSCDGILGASPQRLIVSSSSTTFAEDHLTLQVPIDCGNGRWNCGVSLARLLWGVPAPVITTLLSAMLLERRIVIVSSQRDTVTAAVQAAAALLYPFKWHHIYLPMLPLAFKDYLSAPMPFMVGLPGQMLPLLSSVPMDDSLIVDLDLGTCKPAPGSPGDDARLLPWRDQLEAALSAAHKRIRSPTEHETSPLIAGIMQEYLIKLFGNYRRFIHPDMLPRGPRPGSGGSGAESAQNSPRLGRDSVNGRSGASHLAPFSAQHEGRNGPSNQAIRAAGLVFDHAAFVASYKRNDKAQRFLHAFRGSQMYAMFIQERLELAAAGQLQDCQEPFEQRVERFLERRAQHQAARQAMRNGQLPLRWYHPLNKHHRTDSEEKALGGREIVVGPGSAGGQASGSIGAVALSNSMRRVSTEPRGLADSVTAAPEIDPASFFPLDDAEAPDDVGGAGDGPGHGYAASEASGSPRFATRDSRTQSAGAATLASVLSGSLPSNSGQLGPSRSSVSNAHQSPGSLFRQELQAAAPSLARSSIGESAVLKSYLNMRASLGSTGDLVRVSAQAPHPSTGAGGGGVTVPSTSQQGLMSVSIAPEGHKVFEGSLGNLVKGAFQDIKQAIVRRTSQSGGAPSPSGPASALASSPSINGASAAAAQPGYRAQLTGGSVQGPPRGGGGSGGLLARLIGRDSMDGGPGGKPGPGLLSKYLPQGGLGGGVAQPLATSFLEAVSNAKLARSAGGLRPTSLTSASALSTRPQALEPSDAVSTPAGGPQAPLVQGAGSTQDDSMQPATPHAARGMLRADGRPPQPPPALLREELDGFAALAARPSMGIPSQAPPAAARQAVPASPPSASQPAERNLSLLDV